MKLHPDDALRIATLFNSVAVAERMAAAPQYDTGLWLAAAKREVFELLDNYGIHVIGYAVAIARREAEQRR